MTLNEYIIAHADQGGDADFLRSFGAVEVFFSIDAPGGQWKEGPLVVSADANLRMPVVKLGSDRMVLFYASKQDARLSEPFAGMPLMRAVEMVCSLSDADGMLIQSDTEAWVAVRKEVLRDVFA